VEIRAVDRTGKAAERAGVFSEQVATEARVAPRAWERAVEELRQNADTPLPELPE
jgi:hypothetical protein